VKVFHTDRYGIWRRSGRMSIPRGMAMMTERLQGRPHRRQRLRARVRLSGTLLAPALDLLTRHKLFSRRERTALLTFAAAASLILYSSTLG
jgi:hypothetical protein